MAKVVALVVSALCVLVIAAISPADAWYQGPPHTRVTGKVYCDPCRIQFETKLSHDIEGATVLLTCRDPATEEKQFEQKAKTNSTGQYTMSVEGDHSDQICEVSVIESGDEHCKETMEDVSKAQVDLALNEGITSKVRFVNPLGFMVKKASSKCKKVLDDMGIVPDQE